MLISTTLVLAGAGFVITSVVLLGWPVLLLLGGALLAACGLLRDAG